MGAWQGAEEFERKVPLSEAVRQKRVQDFLDGISAQIAAKKQNAVPTQLNIPGISPTLDSLRSKEPSPYISIDQMKALGLQVPEYPSSPYSRKVYQRNLLEQLATTKIPYSQQGVLPGSVNRRRVAGRFPVELLLAAIASGAGGVVAADAINQPNQELVEVM